MVLHGDLVLVEKLFGIISPSPLAVVSIAERAVAHGAVANKEEHGVVATATASRFHSGLTYLVKAVECEVLHFVYILHSL